MASSGQRTPPVVAEDEALPEKRARGEGASGRVELNPADCNLDFNVDGGGLQGHALHENGFAYCWSGARATVGVTGGKYCFGCKIISEQAVDMADTTPDKQHVCRLGISRGDDPVGNLGETLHSFGFGGTGKFSNAGKFSDYGTKFGVGDTIVCTVDLENRPLASVGFSKNGKWLGISMQFDASSRGLGVVDTPLRKLPWESALFPHVLLKNVVVQLQFGVEDGLILEEGYKPWSSALGDGNAIIGPSFSSAKECEVLMMVGLPASGKTTWADKWAKEHPEKRYVLLGTNLALEQMKVPGLLRKHNYGERFDRLMDRATEIFNMLLKRASKTPRNYILDQTNVYKSARIRKLKSFVNYRKVAVVIFPTPEELKNRANMRFKEMGKEVPAEAVNEMLANYVLPMSKGMPGSTEPFDEVIFPELSRGDAQKYLVDMKQTFRAPNMSAMRDHTHYSRESSVQSTSSFMSKEAGPVSIKSIQNHWLPGLRPAHSNMKPRQVSPAYSMAASNEQYHSRFGDTGIPISGHDPHGNFSQNERSSLPRHRPLIHGNYAGLDPFHRIASERTPCSPGDAGPYQGGHDSTDTLRSHNLEIPSSIDRSGYKHPSTPPLYSSPAERFRGDPGFARVTTLPPYISPFEHLPHHGAPRVDQHLRDPGFARFNTPPLYGNPVEHLAHHGSPRVDQHRLDPGFVRFNTPPLYGNPAEHLNPGSPQVDHYASRHPHELQSTLRPTYDFPYATPQRPSRFPPTVNQPPGS